MKSQDLGVGEGSEQHTLDFVPEAEARDSANTLFTVIRFQMILSAALLFIMVFALIKEKPLNTGPYDRLWKLFGNVYAPSLRNVDCGKKIGFCCCSSQLVLGRFSRVYYSSKYMGNTETCKGFASS